MPHTTTGHPNNHTATRHSRLPFSISRLCRLINNLVESRKYIICKLNLRHRSHALGSRSNRKSYNSLLRQRSIEYSFRAKVRLQVRTASEHATKGNVFAKE